MTPSRQIFALALIASLAPAALRGQASLAGPRLFPRGARAAGTQETTFDAVAIAYHFTLKSVSGSTIVQYRLPMRHANMLRGVLRIEETTTGLVPMTGGGLLYRDTLPGAADYGTVLSAYDLAFSPATDPLHTGTLLAHSLNNLTGVVTVTFRDDYLVGGVPVPSEKTYELRLRGKSLEIHATSDHLVNSFARYNHAGFEFGPGDGLASPNLAFHVPYMDSVPVFIGDGGVFATRIVDWYRSSASDVRSTAPSVSGTTFAGEAAPVVYRNDFNEVNAPIDETVYITVSNDVNDVFPVVDRHPSAYRRHVADRAVSQATPGSHYASNSAWAARSLTHGMTDMAHIKWDWSKWPFNLNDPDIIPSTGLPFPVVACGQIWGTQSEWLTYANTVAAGNWTFAPYFEETGNDPGYPNLLLNLPGSLPGSVLLTPNPSYSAAASVRDAAGVAKPGWDTNLNLAGTNLAGQGHPIDIIGSHLRPAWMTFYGNAIHGVAGHVPFPVAGAHTDAATGLSTWNEIDQRKNSGFPKTVAENMKWREASFGALKDGMDGPLFGENSHWRYQAFETYDAGLLDGTSRKIPVHWSPAQGPHGTESKNYLVVPDFELAEVVTKATGFFGMGWESHFSNAGPWGFDDNFVDAWQATMLSYGHAPFFGTNGDVPNNYWDWQRNIRSYYLCHGVSKAMRTSTAKFVRYEDGAGIERTLSEALGQVAAGTINLSTPRLVLRFGNGLEFKANHSATNWTTTVLGQSFVLPPNGFAAAGPGGLLAFSAINPTSGVRVDYANNPGHSEMIDRRGANQSYNGFPGALLPVPPSLPVLAGLNNKFMVIVKDLRQNRASYASGLDEGSVSLGAQPAPMSLAVEIDDTATLSTGRPRIGVRAVLTDGIGNQRDVTGLCSWSSTNPAVATVNRFGGMAMVTNGNTTINATYAPAALNATRTITATLAPVLTPLQLEAVATTRAFLSFTTDAACTGTIQLLNTSTGVIATVPSRTDPAQKVHHFALRSLTSATTYIATPTAVNVGTQTTTGASFTFTTL